MTLEEAKAQLAIDCDNCKISRGFRPMLCDQMFDTELANVQAGAEPTEDEIDETYAHLLDAVKRVGVS